MNVEYETLDVLLSHLTTSVIAYRSGKYDSRQCRYDIILLYTTLDAMGSDNE